MLSFTKLSVALLSLSATVFAGAVEEGDIFHNGLAKRAVGSDNASENMTALEKRASGNNLGKRCNKHTACRTTKPLAKAFCNKGRCDFRCTGHSVRQGNHCVGPVKAKQCKFNANCPTTKIAHGVSVCYQNKCTFRCLSGYHAVGNKCQKNQHLCGGRSCPHVGNGYAICQNGRWVPQCHFYLGYKLYQRNGQYNCINTAVDPANCGRVGRSCPAGYNGLGRRTCRGGVCDLDCYPYRKLTLPNGQAYCSRA